jgi:activator of 2-hydroxyglutaryl-CoA dehydratase
MIKTLESGLGVTLNVSPEAHYMGALGAALFALDHIRASRAPARAGAAS